MSEQAPAPAPIATAVPLTAQVPKAAPEQLYINPKTGLVACRFIGFFDNDAADPKTAPRLGHAGAGALNPGEIRGFDPTTAADLISKGVCEAIDVDTVNHTLAQHAAWSADAAAAEAAVKTNLKEFAKKGR